MQIKIISVDTTSCFFHRLAESLDEKVAEWTECNPSVNIKSVTPNFHNFTDPDSGDMVAVMTATIIYE